MRIGLAAKRRKKAQRRFMTEEEQGVLDERVALEVMGFRETYVKKVLSVCFPSGFPFGEAWGRRVDCYDLGETQIRQDDWKPTRNEEQFRMVKDRLTELGLSFEEIARNEHVPANLVFRVYRGCSENVKSNFMEALRGWTIQELGVACAIEAVERTKKATKE